MKYINYLFLLCIVLCCCKGSEELTLKRIKYTGNNIKLKGYYYSEENDEKLFFLYQNGVFVDFSIEILSLKPMSRHEKRDSSIRYYVDLGYFNNTQYGWGVWEEMGNQIQVEKWLAGSGGPYPVGRYKGEIMNDSTIRIAFTYHLPPKGNEKKEIFRFRKFSPKPDSTNMFIN